MKKESKILIKVEGFQRQRFLMNCALECISSDGREFEPKIDNISMLLALVGDVPLKDHWGKELNAIKKRIERLKEKISEIVAYHSDIDKNVVSREDITSQRFARYIESISYAIKNIFFIDEITLLLVKETTLQDATIPSSYFTVLSQKEKQMPLSVEESEYMESEMDSEAMPRPHPMMDRNLDEYEN